MRQFWQIAAGESGRFYNDLFLNHDVMFIDHGDFVDSDESMKPLGKKDYGI